MLVLSTLEIGPENSAYTKYIIDPDNSIESITDRNNRYYPQYNCCVRMKSGEEFYAVSILIQSDTNSKSYSIIEKLLKHHQER